MSIYSTNNRAGAVSESTAVTPNMNYGSSDISRIMYEAQVNDMAIFEATLACDFQEIQGLREGTLLESELAAFQEASVKGVFKTIRDALKSFWEKLKGAFSTVINKISAYVLHDGKAFAKEFRAAEAKYGKFTGTLPEKAKYRVNDEAVKIPSYQSVKESIDNAKDGDVVSADVIAEGLAKAINYTGPDMMSPTRFREEVVEIGFYEENVDNNAVENMLKIISGSGADNIKRLKKVEQNMDSNLKALEQYLIAAEKTHLKHGVEKDEKSEAKDTIRNITTLVSAYKSIVGTLVSTKIGFYKSSIKRSRKLLGAVLSEMKGNKAEAKNEAATLGEDEVDLALDDTINEPLDTETQAEVDEFVASADVE